MKVYQQWVNDEPKEVILSIEECSCGYLEGEHIVLSAVDENGYKIAELLCLSSLGLTVQSNARKMLADTGYDTSCLAWDYNGAIKIVGE